MNKIIRNMIIEIVNADMQNDGDKNNFYRYLYASTVN